MVVHDGAVADAEGVMRPIVSLTLEELRGMPRMADVLTLEEVARDFGGRIGLAIEAKPQVFWEHAGRLTHGISRVLTRHPPRHGCLMDSFDLKMAGSLKNFVPDCEVAWDSAFEQPVTADDLNAVLQHGLGWLYVNAAVASPSLVREAHEAGVRVMVYTVNDDATIERFGAEMPDGFITDERTILRRFRTSE